jgi:hypothetical protein
MSAPRFPHHSQKKTASSRSEGCNSSRPTAFVRPIRRNTAARPRIFPFYTSSIHPQRSFDSAIKPFLKLFILPFGGYFFIIYFVGFSTWQVVVGLWLGAS